MLILGIDPGTTRMGYAIIDVSNSKLNKVLSIGYVNLSDISEHAEKLKNIYEEINCLIEKYRPDALAIESPFYGKNVQSMLKLGRAQGVAMAVAFVHQLSVTEYAPKKVKSSITGNGNASKEQVFAMLKNLISFDYIDKYLDATDALAVAVCHYFQISKSSLQNIPNALSKKPAKRKNSWKNFIQKHPDRKL